MKQYKAIFFDWDGTAVASRKAPVEEVAALMGRLLGRGVKLAIISGTTMENIAGGNIGDYFEGGERQNLFLGLGRGAYNYHFREDGQVELLSDRIPNRDKLLEIHRVCFEVHEFLLKWYGFPTDIVFSRPNYCKVDLMVGNNRGDQLFFQENELLVLEKSLEMHGFEGGLRELVRLAEGIGLEHGMELSATTDAKYLEIGLSSKSDNVDMLLSYLEDAYGIKPEECCFWGDEYIGLDQGLFGSDSFMMTELSKGGDFFDVSEAKGERPEGVRVLGGGVKRFLEFLDDFAGA